MRYRNLGSEGNIIMAEQSEMHFEIIDSNKAKAREEQNAMREDIKQHVENKRLNKSFTKITLPTVWDQ